MYRGRPVSYGELLSEFEAAQVRLEAAGVPAGAVVAVEGDFSPESIGLLFALIELRAIYVPISRASAASSADYHQIAEVEYRIEMREPGFSVTPTGRKVTQNHLVALKEAGHPGLILFSSGSTGKSKGAVHDFLPLLAKFQEPRKSQSMIAFLLFDHIGGINTVLASVSSGGLLVIPQERSPAAVGRLIESYKVETLPTTPTFLNLLLLSEANREFDLSSLTTITYGTEVMPESTLRRVHEAFPSARLHQTYGLTEVGILRTKSEASDSLWVRMGGEGYETRVRNGLLEIRAGSSMLGYLNAPSPFTEDGWFMTYDAVETKGEYFRILGRQSECINVGGEKVYPAEVESVLQAMPEVEAVVVMGEKNALMGQIVKAMVRLNAEMPLSEFRLKMRQYCSERLPAYKIPQKVEVLGRAEYTERFKKDRRQEPHAT